MKSLIYILLMIILAMGVSAYADYFTFVTNDGSPTLNGSILANTNISCSDIIGGSDSDYCTDTSGAGGVGDGNVSSICADNLVLLGQDTTTCIDLNATIDDRVSATGYDGNASSICADNEVLLGQDTAMCIDLNSTIDSRDTNTWNSSADFTPFFNTKAEIAAYFSGNNTFWTTNNATMKSYVDARDLANNNSLKAYGDATYTTGAHTNLTKEDIIGMSFLNDTNYTTLTTYIDTQDSAQDACSEITGCVENAVINSTDVKFREIFLNTTLDIGICWNGSDTIIGNLTGVNGC